MTLIPTNNSIVKNLIMVALMATMFSCTKHEPILYMVGDSTMADKEKMYLPERGWGQVLPDYFNSNFKINNHAKNGRSTRSFIYEGRWDSVCNKIQAGDFVIIQFGHNDDVETKIGRHSTLAEYEYNLRKFVNEAKQKQAKPILATPIVRRRFDDNNEFFGTHGNYPDAVRKVAKDLNIPLLEMHLKSMKLVKDFGAEKSKKIYLHIAPGVNDSLPDGKIDDTHFSEFGANEMAKIAMDEIKLKAPELAIYLKE